MQTSHLYGAVGAMVTGIIVLGVMVDGTAVGIMVDGTAVGAMVNGIVGAVLDGTPVGAAVSVAFEGLGVTGADVGPDVGEAEGLSVGAFVSDRVGAGVGESEGLSVGAFVSNKASNSSMRASKLPHDDLPLGG